jgi:hypothetical protein
MSVDIQESRICIVYFAYINPDPRKDWRSILNGQMDDLIRCGVLSHSSLEIVLSATPELAQQAHTCLESILSSFTFKNFTIVHENHFEYEGIKRLHDLSQIYPNKIFLYFHSKGMVYYEDQHRVWLEQMLTKITLTKWRDVIFIFEQYSDINKIGSYPSNHEGHGCIWFNFFWVRGSYIKTCNKPGITDDRYYYEYWLGYAGNKSLHDSYGLISRNKNKYSKCDVVYSIVDIESKNDYDIPSTFDWCYYINRYEDLKLFIHSEEQARLHYRLYGIFEDREYCDIPNFDWKSYFIHNDDLRDNMICTREDLIFHYKMFGHKERRIYFSIPEEFDYVYYLHLYEDLGHAGFNDKYAAALHYFHYGKTENRKISDLPAGFDWEKYVAKYPDLQENLIITKRKAIDHYRTFGKNEGRTWN